MDIKNGDLGLSCTVPDAPTVRQVVAYDSARAISAGEPALLVLWQAALTVISDWKCDALPDCHTPLDKMDASKAAVLARVVEFIGISVSAWRRSLDAVPKN